ncbi:MAPEG family protein [Paraliomyxa miuraensis]|uniref:MAPEG family protein n=1 Tax=Paraliomyxa miuraensis TaxID=376150 RepID=UPI0022553523|nr:MAPEG family protein [Paraliomyxa miuraensis]MCX4240897.1 MAPEG family protein [Paraliomyxa miuraensis]
MTTPFVCVLLAFLLIYLPKLPLSVVMARQPGGYDNKQPRQQQAKLEGLGARAAAAHYNGFEAFPAFAAAVLVAHLAGGNDYRSSVLSVAFVVARTLYVAAYLADQDYLRSAIWGIGFLCTVALFCLPWLG